MKKRIGAHAAFANADCKGNGSLVMFGPIVVASAPDLGALALGMKFGLVPGQCVLHEDGSIKEAWNSAGQGRTAERFTAEQRKMLKDHAARHPHGPVARELAERGERSTRARALRLGLRLAPRRTVTRHVPTRRAPRQVRRVRRAAPLVARSPDEPPTAEGGDAPRRGDRRQRGAR